MADHPDHDDLDALAAEYVLGQLDAGERRAAEIRLAADPRFRVSVAEWETRLQPLADTAGEEAPRADTFGAILARLDRTETDPGDVVGEEIVPVGNVVLLRRSVTRWRFTAALVGAAAAVLAGVVVVDHLRPAVRSEYVAILTAEGAKPAFVASIDTARGTISVRRVVADAPPDKSYELWAIPPGGVPKSLGVVEQASYRRVLDLQAGGGFTFAVSLEPKGGSPTGSPTGPVVFSGVLVPAE